MVGRNGIWPHRHEEGNNVVVHADVVWMVLVHKGWGRYGVAACGVNGIRSCIILDMNRNIPLYKAYSLSTPNGLIYQADFFFLDMQTLYNDTLNP